MYIYLIYKLHLCVWYIAQYVYAHIINIYSILYFSILKYINYTYSLVNVAFLYFFIYYKSSVITQFKNPVSFCESILKSYQQSEQDSAE